MTFNLDLASARSLLATLLTLFCTSGLSAEDFSLETQQITTGPQHHFFGYIGQSLTTPWNASGRYILSLRTSFHDRMPHPGEAADVVLIDTQNAYAVSPIEKSRAWNFQQGTMFYWHPKHPETQFFFNDRDPNTNTVFTVLYDIEQQRRIREYRFQDISVANGGVSPTGDFFLAINYGRMAKLRPVTGYPGAVDHTDNLPAPDNDGIFRVDVETGKHHLIVSFKQLRDLLKGQGIDIKDAHFYINHSLANRTGELVYFYARGRRGDSTMAINVPCSVRTNGTELRAHEYIGGHPEWDQGTVVIGAKGKDQVRYDIQTGKIIGQIATPEIIPGPGGDVSLSPDGNWFVCGYSTKDRKQNKYVIVRRSDGAFAASEPFSRGPYRRGELRIDPAPRWNRDQSTILIPAFTSDGTRQLQLLKIK
ncbi:MAG: hypothetical protein GY768_05700 [Planctomycetaceae bacterium]|nr:hypothetical protein [Planctomycetaceae bacterium]